MSYDATHKNQAHQLLQKRRRRRGGKGSMWTLLLVLAVVFLNRWNNQNQAEQLEGRVLHVQDGDSFVMTQNNKKVTIRMFAIDCPEKGQPFGHEAKVFTTDLIENQPVKLDVQDKDRYGRLVSLVYLEDGTCLNHELVRAGLAWWYRRHAQDNRELERLEKQARSNLVGLWSEKQPTAPWDYRNR